MLSSYLTLAQTQNHHFPRLAIEIIKRKKEKETLSEEEMSQWQLDTNMWNAKGDGNYELDSVKFEALTSLRSSSPARKASKDPVKSKGLMSLQTSSPAHETSQTSQSPKSDSKTKSGKGKYLFGTLETSSWKNLQQDVRVISNLQFPFVFREGELIEVIMMLKYSTECKPIENRICKHERDEIEPLKDIDQITRQKTFRVSNKENRGKEWDKGERGERAFRMSQQENSGQEWDEGGAFRLSHKENWNREGSGEEVNIMDEGNIAIASKALDSNEWTFGPKLFNQVKSETQDLKKRKTLSESSSQNSGTKKIKITGTSEEINQNQTIPTYHSQQSTHIRIVQYRDQSTQTPIVKYRNFLMTTSPTSEEKIRDRILRADTLPDDEDEETMIDENTRERLLNANTLPDDPAEEKIIEENTLDRIMKADTLRDEPDENQSQDQSQEKGTSATKSFFQKLSGTPGKVVKQISEIFKK